MNAKEEKKVKTEKMRINIEGKWWKQKRKSRDKNSERGSGQIFDIVAELHTKHPTVVDDVCLLWVRSSNKC